jgi:hypothetical protein
VAVLESEYHICGKKVIATIEKAKNIRTIPKIKYILETAFRNFLFI